MDSPVRELENILILEQQIYEKVASIEEEKTGTILSRDGYALESQARLQESFFAEIENLEKKREKVVSECNITHAAGNASVSLKDVIAGMDAGSAEKLMRCGIELKKTVLRIQSLSRTNNRLLEDNMEFFNILLSGLKDSVSLNTGYTKEGGSSRVMSGSMIFNKTM